MQPVFVGDVQGCADELDVILERSRRAFGSRFTLHLVGDVVNRGPDNLRVLRGLRELEAKRRATWVLGNHEVGLLSTAFGLRRYRPLDTFRDVLDAPDVDDWLDWVRTRPLAVGGTLGEQPYALVHAASHPLWSRDELLECAASVHRELAAGRDAARALLADPEARRDLDRLTRCRSVAADDPEAWSDDVPEGGRVAWHEPWSRQAHRHGIVYGHWSLQGLHVAPGLRGLDTGCVHHGLSGHGSLTAWVPDLRRARPFDVPDEDFWQVPARRAYYLAD